jgi:hypothetical protein
LLEAMPQLMSAQLDGSFEEQKLKIKWYGRFLSRHGRVQNNIRKLIERVEARGTPEELKELMRVRQRARSRYYDYAAHEFFAPEVPIIPHPDDRRTEFDFDFAR